MEQKMNTQTQSQTQPQTQTLPQWVKQKYEEWKRVSKVEEIRKKAIELIFKWLPELPSEDWIAVFIDPKDPTVIAQVTNFTDSDVHYLAEKIMRWITKEDITQSMLVATNEKMTLKEYSKDVIERAKQVGFKLVGYTEWEDEEPPYERGKHHYVKLDETDDIKLYLVFESKETDC